MTARRSAAAAAFLACILLANFATDRLHMVPVGFGLTATAGTWLAGASFVLRDALQDLAGKRATLGIIAAGAALSFLVAGPRLALASAAAFALSEGCDLAIYSPLRARGYLRAAVASNIAGAVVDTVAFLHIARFPIAPSLPGQLVGKLTITLAAVIIVLGARRVLYLGNPCSPAVLEAMRAGTLGYIDTPAQGNKRPTGVTWCADNGCFSARFDELKWWRWLTDNAGDAARCLFAVAPDVVGNAAATLERSRPWLGRIRELGYPAAFVAQDGLEYLLVPWDEFDCLFIGGSTGWKLGPAARELAGEAKRRGKRVHCGRVNSEKRFRYAAAPHPFGLGADSCDGTFLTFGPDINLPRLRSWLRATDQPALDFQEVSA